MSNRRFYGRPPLIEALCQFRFVPGREWDNTVPGLLYAKIQNDFPKRRKHAAFEFLLEPGSSEVKKVGGDRTQFLSADQTSLVQVGADLLIINVLRPYPGWEGFRRLIISTLEHYVKVAEPAGLRSLALRYINRIALPDVPSVTVEHYLTFSPDIPEGLPQDLSAWTQSVDLPVENVGLLRLTSGSAKDDDNLAFILDIEFIGLNRDRLTFDQLPEYLDQAHGEIETAFELCLTDQARSLFEEETRREQTSVG